MNFYLFQLSDEPECQFKLLKGVLCVFFTAATGESIPLVGDFYV